jgi:hypothetical protein
MKRNVFTLLVFVFTSYAASAQTEMGNWLVGGNLQLNTAKNNTTIGVSPTAGYFFADNFAAGAMLDINYYNGANTSNTNLGFGPFARYYFGTSNTRPLVQGSWNYLSIKDKIDNPSSSTTLNGSQFFLGGGLAGFINRNVALEALAGYNHIKYRHAGDDGSGGFLFKVGFQVYLSGSQMSKVTGQK